MEELIVQINWREIFRYWTEIRAKYHLENDDEEFNTDYNEKEKEEDSVIKIKGLNLNFDRNNYELHKVDDPISHVPVDVDLMKDFVSHIIAQFRIEIKETNVLLSDDLSIHIPRIIILPEINGLRRITFSDDISIKSRKKQATGRIQKGTEISIMRTVEGNIVVRVKAPQIEIETINLNSLNSIIEMFEFKETSKENDSNNTIELSIDMLRFTLGPLHLTTHEIWLDSTGSFIIGHFNLKLNHYCTVMSPIQTHVITGDYKKGKLLIEDEIVIRLRDYQQIEEIIKALELKVPGSKTSNYTKMSLRIMTVKLFIDNINMTLNDIIFNDNVISIKNIVICYNNSKIEAIGFKYIMQPEVEPMRISPFAELKRLIENDEILSLEDEKVIYESCKGSIDNFEVEKVKGIIELDDIEKIPKFGNNEPKKSISAMGTIVNSNVSLQLANSSTYQVQFKSVRLLKTRDFIDLRGKLDFLKRNEKTLIHSVDFSAVKTEDISVITLKDLNLLLPYNLNEKLTDDLKLFDFRSKNESAQVVNFQLSFKNSKVKLEGPDNLVEPVESEIVIKEINCKFNVCYVDEAVLKLNNQSIFNSGLMKIKYEAKSINLVNHCSNIDLTQNGYRNLIKFAVFWSEIYSPLIEVIYPEAIFHDEILKEEAGINGILMQFEGERDGDIELELELELEHEPEENEIIEPIEHDIIIEPVEIIDRGKTDQLTENLAHDMGDLLKDVDYEFFVNKAEERFDEISMVNFLNFGIKINLISAENENFTISLDGIDGSISSKSVNLKVKAGSAHKNTKTILHRWPRGPDVTCKYSIEDGNFLSIKAEKLGIKNDAGIDEYNLTVSVCPLRLFLDQKSLNGMAKFFANEPENSFKEPMKRGNSEKMRSFIFFNKVSVSPLVLKIDYNPNSTASSAPIPLQGAEMILPRVEVRGVKGFEGLGPAVYAAWIPELKGKKLTGVLATGLVPVRTIVNLGGGVVELILLPWQLGPQQSSAQTIAQIRKNGKRIGLETLKLTASLANRTSKLLSTQTASEGCAYPTDFQTGVQQAAQLIIALPTRFNQNDRSALRAVPLLVLDSVATASGALAKTLQGIQAEFDREIFYERKIKRK